MPTANARSGGCFLVNTVLEVGRHNAVVRSRLRRHLDAIERELAEALQAAHAAGLLAPRRSPRRWPKFLMATIWGVHCAQWHRGRPRRCTDGARPGMAVLDA